MLRIRAWVTTAVLFLVFVAGWNWLTDGQATSATSTQVAIERWKDGDTLVVSGFGSERETVRLIGVDTPETKHPSKGVQCFGPQASAFAKRTWPKGSAMVLKLDRGAPERDRYGRVLGYLFETDGTMANLVLVQRGYAEARYYSPHNDHRRQLERAERKAKRQGKGEVGRVPDPLSERRGSLIGARDTWPDAMRLARRMVSDVHIRVAVFYGKASEFSDQPPEGPCWWVAFGSLHPWKAEREWNRCAR